jgi:hypothetical protein
MMISRDAVVLDSDMLDEARAYLRLEGEEDDASLGSVLLGAIGHAEAYLGQMLLRAARVRSCLQHRIGNGCRCYRL